MSCARGRPADRPGARGVALLLTVTAVGACAAPASGHAPAGPVPDVLAAGWLRPGGLDIRFTVENHAAAGTAGAMQVHTVLTIGPAGRPTAMRTVQSGDGMVASRTQWSGGPTITTTDFPGCRADVEPIDVPSGVAGWLAEPFGPVDPATGGGWTVANGVATRPGSSADTIEQAPLTALDARTVREVNRRTGAVVNQVGAISIRHLDATGPALPACGAPWQPS
jgi:hypothetical protein